MATVLLFHHALGLTPGVVAFADALHESGHTVHTPDLYEGRVFDDLDEGVAHAEQIGFTEIIARGVAVASSLPAELVYAGFSLGGLPAQAVAQRRPGALGALLYHSGVAPEDLGGVWPAGVPLQIHVMEQDPWGEMEVYQQLADRGIAELFVYPGSGHLFADATSPDYDAAAADLLMQRTLALLEGVS